MIDCFLVFKYIGVWLMFSAIIAIFVFLFNIYDDSDRDYFNILIFTEVVFSVLYLLTIALIITLTY